MLLTVANRVYWAEKVRSVWRFSVFAAAAAAAARRRALPLTTMIMARAEYKVADGIVENANNNSIVDRFAVM